MCVCVYKKRPKKSKIIVEQQEKREPNFTLLFAAGGINQIIGERMYEWRKNINYKLIRLLV